MSSSKLLPILAAAFIVASCASAPKVTKAEKVDPAPNTADTETPVKSEARNRAQDLISGGNAPAKTEAQKTDTAVAITQTSTEASSPETAATVELSDKEKKFFDNYLKRLKYMMVLKEGAAVDEFQKRSILTKGNEYLLKQGYDVVHYDQLAKNMEDQRGAYEAEVGSSMSLTQYIAQKLGADVYVELDSAPRSWTENGRYYGEANFTANMLDPSTAELLGSVTYRTDRSLSSSSERDALLNALTAGTAQFMPRVVRDSSAVLRNRYSNGIRYQVIIQRTADSRAISTFRRNIRSRVREISMGPSAADQSIMDIYLFGSISDLEDACYSAFEKTPGMESTYWVYTRGKTLTFNTGN
ncbi:hypothetical protein MASR2M78_34410 [Treponema sp.]